MTPVTSADISSLNLSSGNFITQGLTTFEAENRFKTAGPNSMPDTNMHPLRRAIDELWAPVPWMLELAVILQLIMHQYTEATMYNLRERKHLWSSTPGNWLIIATLGDILIISTLSIRGIAMQALPVSVIASTLLSAIIFAFSLDLIKVPVFRKLSIA